MKRTDDTTKDGRHHFKWLKYMGDNVRIDRDIAPLLSKMWKLGIQTTNSCQAHCNFNCKHKRKQVKSKKYGTYSEVIPTKHCYNNVWICFHSATDLELFYNMVAEYTKDRDSMYNAMGCDAFMQTQGTNFMGGEKRWSFSFLLRNFGVEGHWGRPKFKGKRSTREMWIDDGCKKNNFMISPQVTFPRDHLPYIEDRLQQALDKKGKRHVVR
jgi:hypothetical protein